MAIGILNFTADSATVTGTGTAFLQDLAPHFGLLIGGLTYLVQSIETQHSLTLNFQWDGETVSVTEWEIIKTTNMSVQLHSGIEELLDSFGTARLISDDINTLIDATVPQAEAARDLAQQHATTSGQHAANSAASSETSTSMRDQTISERQVVEGHRIATGTARDVTIAKRNEASAFRDQSSSFANNASSHADAAASSAEAAATQASLATTSRESTEQARDVTIMNRDEASDFRDQTAQSEINAAASATASANSAAAAAVFDPTKYALKDPRVFSTATASSLVLNPGLYDVYDYTALDTDLSGMAVNGSPPVNGQKATIRICDNGTARTLHALSSGNFAAVGVALPVTTMPGKVMYIGAIYNAGKTRWDIVSVAREA